MTSLALCLLTTALAAIAYHDLRTAHPDWGDMRLELATLAITSAGMIALAFAIYAVAGPAPDLPYHPPPPIGAPTHSPYA